ncbi:MAG: hypothetical protein ABI986_05585 [Chloroflexota bacterium]
MFNWLKQFFGKRQSVVETKLSLSLDDKEVKLSFSDGRNFIVAWSDIIGVAIQTTDEGPFQPDVFWLLRTKEHAVRIPQGITGEKELLHRLQQLPSFDNNAVISAMGSTENNLFVCWEKKEKN